jgi:farnesyl-diphosphate farnesyltransferase
LTLRVLPAAIRSQISLAYLLARTSDTIADTGLVPIASRLRALAGLRAAILGGDSPVPDFGVLAQNQALPAERALLQRAGETLHILGGFAEEDRRLIRDVLGTILSGQEMDLQRFAPTAPEKIAALETEAELDDYTWRVAGCVGEFWTRLCCARLFSPGQVDEAVLLRDGVRLGKGLQLVNILRDLPEDLRRGRCYLPRQSLAAAGMTPEDLLSSAGEARFRPLYQTWLDRAESHLQAGWNYTNALPGGQCRLRLACAWPVLFGARTLGALRGQAILDPTRRLKIPRSQVYAIMGRTVLFLVIPPAWKAQFVREKTACK